MAPSVEKRAGRRKVALACNPCRERKSRCDGAKPTCSSCLRRSFPLSHCIYQVENARSASNDAYIASLHERIRELEVRASLVTSNSQPIPTSRSGGIRSPTDIPAVGQSLGDAIAPYGGLGGNETQLTRLDALAATAVSQAAPPRSSSQDQEAVSAAFPLSPIASPYVDYDSTDLSSNVTGMGDIASAVDEDVTMEPGRTYYGSSSAASLMRIAHSSVQSTRASNSQTPPSSISTSGIDVTSGFGGARQSTTTLRNTVRPVQAVNMSIPPRALADHLLERYWDRVHHLYPFVHRPSFQLAYESLWERSTRFETPMRSPDIGLGGAPETGPDSPAFHAALNVMFALGCHFSDFHLSERGPMAHKFFLRSKKFVGLDFLDGNHMGVVQALLIRALFLQSTPYPSRCWMSVGLACRIAQGLGLHTNTEGSTRTFWETEMRRRVWHGCVMMDRIASMTFGRPAMTSHPADVPSPSVLEEDQTPPLDGNFATINERPSKMYFYIKSIDLYNISERIRTTVYQPWLSARKKYGSIDAMIDLEVELTTFESTIPYFLSWTNTQSSHTNAADTDQLSYELQTNVLHARFLHLKLMLYRPILTELCQKRRTDNHHVDAEPRSTSFEIGSNMHYSDFAARCAWSCVTAAVDLVKLLHSSYRTPATGAWWYNGLYASTAGLILTLARICPPLLKSLDPQCLPETFRLCEEILTHLASFSISAHNTLGMLRKLNREINLEHLQQPTEQEEALGSIPIPTIPRESLGNGNGPASGLAASFKDLPSFLNTESFDDFSSLDSSFFSWDPGCELMPDDLYAVLSAPVTPPAWNSGIL